MNQITDISQQVGANSHLRSTNKNKPAEKLLSQLDAWMADESSCHYLSIQITGKEIYPFGIINRPFFHLDQAERKLESLKSSNPEVDYYITAGAFATYALNFEDEEAPMWERVWLNFHEYRLINLQVQKMSHDELVKLVPNYNETLLWQETQNTESACHYYMATALDESDQGISMSSEWFIDLLDAISAKQYFSKTYPGRKVEIRSGVVSTEDLMALDGRTSDCYQALIDAHKERLASLKNKGE
ncbi:hypothetical protein ACN4J7_002198 [Acinetobacter baumannii]|uniref:hypothetical protein n=1 Tax=Acinetobacter baumannii TaxID=470 RepID=UPI000E09D21D|nr:hypothetical protein [Acinetobacter baumannii]AXG84713.1 hypothetical protein Aba810CP_08100 [Acinetobacter baumannii]EKV9433428.1 hypothetical protein [Acinetobacter baumannii]EKW6927152.1 hypothetical protein [Acinetobacter baumannii]ELB2646207.1 hypothetical protein [Acinetobacter baumannii]ELU2203548.1 hypothetical protein [Acinetobacter baumannii]